MNKITRMKDTDILRAWDSENKCIAIAGHTQELLARNILLECHENQGGWLIIPSTVDGQMQESILYGSRDEAKEALRNYIPA